MNYLDILSRIRALWQKPIAPANLLLCILATFAACIADHDDAPEPSDTGTPLLEIRAGIDAPLTRAVGTSWAPGDAIGISSTCNGKATYNVKYITEKGDGVFRPAHPDTAIIYRKDDGQITLYAYYPFTGKNGEFESGTDKIGFRITLDNQTPQGQPSIDYLFATANFDHHSPQLTFQHRMSRIVLNFIAGEGVSTLGNIKCTFEGLALEGWFFRGNGMMENNSISREDLEVSLPDGATTTSFLLIPQYIGDAAVISLTVVMNNTEYPPISLPVKDKLGNPHNTLEPGCQYTYNLTFNNHSVVVGTTDSGAWNEVSPGDIITTPI